MTIVVLCFLILYIDGAVNPVQHVIVGDFNLPCINWCDLQCLNDYIHGTIFNYLVKSGYSQFVTFNTRKNHLLDLILSDDDMLIANVAPLPPIGHSDQFSY